MKKSAAGLRFIVLCKSGREHRLKTVTSRRRARDFVKYFNYLTKPKCGPHRVGKILAAGVREGRKA